MRYLKQFTIILFVSFLGETLHYLIPLPVPAGKFLIDIMPVMFIPAAVGLLDSWGVLQPVWIPVAVITVVSTVVVMVVSGLVAQAVIRHGRKEGKSE